MAMDALEKFCVVVNFSNIILTQFYCCCMKDDTDYCGRWKNTRQQHKTYADTSLTYVDAKVAAALCKGRVIAYLVDPGSGITDELILQHVIPNLMRHGIELQVCKVLGRAMLW